MNLVHSYTLVVNVLAALGITYLVWRDPSSLPYRSRYHLVVVGIVVFIVVSPAVEHVIGASVHWTHGLGTAFILLGLQLVVHPKLSEEDWTEWLLTDPAGVRNPADWMMPMDDQILELFHSTELVSTPSVIALNIDRSHEEVNRRLIELRDEGFVERVARGKYRITTLGEQYLHGQPAGTGSTPPEDVRD